MWVGDKHIEFDEERESDVADSFALRDKLASEGNLPHNWVFNFHSIEEDKYGRFTDKMVGTLFGLFLLWDRLVGGPWSPYRMKNWWNVEMSAIDRRGQDKIGLG